MWPVSIPSCRGKREASSPSHLHAVLGIPFPTPLPVLWEHPALEWLLEQVERQTEPA